MSCPRTCLIFLRRSISRRNRSPIWKRFATTRLKVTCPAGILTRITCASGTTSHGCIPPPLVPVHTLPTAEPKVFTVSSRRLPSVLSSLALGRKGRMAITRFTPLLWSTILPATRCTKCGTIPKIPIPARRTPATGAASRWEPCSRSFCSPTRHKVPITFRSLKTRCSGPHILRPPSFRFRPRPQPEWWER